MAVRNPYAQYKQNSIMTANPQELTLMLYDGAIKFIKTGILFIEEKNIEGAHYSIIRAQDIILEFMSTVDQENEIGKNLFNLYDYMHHRLQQGNIKKDTILLEEVHDMVKELRDTWQEAMKLAKRGK